MKRRLSALLLALCLALSLIPASVSAQTGPTRPASARAASGAAPLAAAGWQKDGNGWRYLGADGSYARSCWLQLGGKWYRFGADGYMQTGWQKVGGKWYYFASGGAMQTGWQKVSGKWYYFASGGAMQTGWQKVSGKWYYLASGGAMQTGLVQVGEKWYYLGNDGVLAYELPSAELARSRMLAQQTAYPEGMAWTNSNTYQWINRLDNYGFYTGGGCVAFAMILSDAAYGELPARTVYDYTYENLHVGDILRINGNTHSVIILEIHPTHVVIAEGNFNSSIHWGRTLTKEQVMAGDYIFTRWP